MSAEQERIEALEKKIAELSATPWWQQPAFLVAIVGLAGGILTYLHDERETSGQLRLADRQAENALEVERKKLYHQMIETAVDEETSQSNRLRTLRFIQREFEGDPVGSWAADEMVIVQKQLDAQRSSTRAAGVDGVHDITKQELVDWIMALERRHLELEERLTTPKGKAK